MNFKLTANTHVGEVRDHNEDNFFVCSDLASNNWSFDKSVESELGELGAVLIVADGMGGMNAGEVASEIAVESSKQQFSERGSSVDKNSEESINAFLKEVIHKAHEHILERQKSDPETQGMGTTLILGWIVNGVAHIGWCGDSRAYLYNPNLKDTGRASQYEQLGLRVKGNLALMSKDHSYVQTLVDKGDLTDSQAFFHPESNIITQSLGQNGQGIAPSTVSFTLYEGDKLILCSDGINAMLEDGDIEKICNENIAASETSNSLISKANEKGGHDNSTVVTFHALSTSNSVANPLASSIKRDLNERTVKKSNYLKFIALTILIVGTIGSLYFTQQDKIPNPSENFLVLEQNLELDLLTLAAGDTIFYVNKEGREEVEINIDQLKEVTRLDSGEFENTIVRLFYISLKPHPVEIEVKDGKEETIETEVNIEVDPKPTPVVSEPLVNSEPLSTITKEWRVLLSTNNIWRDKSTIKEYQNLDKKLISVREYQTDQWIYVYGCFNSEAKAQAWINNNPTTKGAKPYDEIPCGVEDQKPKMTPISKKEVPEEVALEDKPDGVEPEVARNTMRIDSSKEKIIETAQNINDFDGVKQDSSALQTDTSITESIKNI
jgi:serine/threonine protein phosphatase PrpC